MYISLEVEDRKGKKPEGSSSFKLCQKICDCEVMECEEIYFDAIGEIENNFKENALTSLRKFSSVKTNNIECEEDEKLSDTFKRLIESTTASVGIMVGVDNTIAKLINTQAYYKVRKRFKIKDRNIKVHDFSKVFIDVDGYLVLLRQLGSLLKLADFNRQLIKHMNGLNLNFNFVATSTNWENHNVQATVDVIGNKLIDYNETMTSEDIRNKIIEMEKGTVEIKIEEDEREEEFSNDGFEDDDDETRKKNFVDLILFKIPFFTIEIENVDTESLKKLRIFKALDEARIEISLDTDGLIALEVSIEFRIKYIFQTGKKIFTNMVEYIIPN